MHSRGNQGRQPKQIILTSHVLPFIHSMLIAQNRSKDYKTMEN